MSTYAQIRVAKINSFVQLSRTETHNERLHGEKGYEEPKHIDQDNKHLNQNMLQTENYAQAIKDRFSECGIKPRKNGVIALEYVIGMSREFWKDTNMSPQHANMFMFDQMKYLVNKHGADNIISATTHFDESNPHLHVVVTPIIEKSTKRFPDAKPRLCARDFVGGRKKLSDMQNEFYEHCKPLVKRHGHELTKHTPIKEQKREYEEKTNAKLGAIRNKIIDLNIEFQKVLESKEAAQDHMAKLIKELENEKSNLMKLDIKFQKEEKSLKQAENDVKKINDHKMDSKRKLKKPKSNSKDSSIGL